jgi:hypothetical protein
MNVKVDLTVNSAPAKQSPPASQPQQNHKLAKTTRLRRYHRTHGFG